ncbi:DNA/RNA helicase [Hydrococcus rivularis NIES-593]|uniref:DNA/RNA helicase n=1 Tax=Hydrococcus rivularis NIES-593 TaxID=1921803 RepID=A0A1U7HT17_9CYAN|nr:pentapeptide repeat-containing protein [Hydrococcus rivularis]OKH26717.1 DNA/RNA helicase [Hydrococcus rivularis NIES-593]
MVKDYLNHKFITTEPLGNRGETGEQLVWDSIRANFRDRDCIGYWRYPIFSQIGKFRQEPDILIVDRELGLVVIEVKSIPIDKIVNITGHRWEYQNFYTPFGNPYQQAENQLFTILESCDREPILQDKISARALVALPLISQQQWQERGFDKLLSNPPILFKDNLYSASSVCELIQETPPVKPGYKLTLKQWQLLLSILSGTPFFCRPSHRVLTPDRSRGKILQKLRSHISEFDWQQEKIAKQIAPGAQRIRGIAGSGKTVLLCQKAAHIHLKYPNWKVAFVFFSRSLYHSIIQQIDKWLRHFSNNERGYDPKNANLKILHAWGARKQPGLYSLICQAAGIHSLTVNETASQKPNEALAEACIQLLKATAIPQLFDAILIDEGQDLIVDKYKFGDRQPFYWMAYQSLQPVDPVRSEQRRLIWAYDEAQSLESLTIPTASELFGEDLGHLVTGQYKNGIKKSEVMRRCYRTPHQIITAAHGLGMGLLRPQGMLTGITRAEEWKAIGYEVQGRFIPGQKIILKRPRENSPNPIPELWQGDIIEFKAYESRQQELFVLAKNIKHNLRYDGLRPSQEILVIVVGEFFDAIQLETQVANFLMRQGIDIFIPGNSKCNTLLDESGKCRNPNKFWHEGAVTISRIHRAKGNEADMVYIVGCDRIAEDESNIYLRNQLFIALTRARAWVKLSGIGTYPMYEEIEQVIRSRDTFTFTFHHPPKREINVTDASELLKRYALGGRNFQNIDLSNADLIGVNLSHANLIGANLRGANLQRAQLDGVKLIAADLSHANLKDASLRNAKLMGTILQGTNLSNVDLKGADLSEADLTGAKLKNTKLNEAILEGVKISE